MEDQNTKAIVGCLLGTAIGDSIGLPSEGLSPRRRRKLFPGPLAHRLIFGHGMISDDTEHTCLVADALIESAGDAAIFQRALARGLRRWLLVLPAATGLATLRAALKLCVGVDPAHSGVYSAGNGPAMRSALIGVCYGSDPVRLRNLVAISTRMTHTDPKAEHAALGVAVAAHLSSSGGVTPHDYYTALRASLGDDSSEFLSRIREVVESITADESTPCFAARIGLARGPSGYCMESVPVALHACLRHPTDFHAAIHATVDCGGDTDTMAAIAGGIIGANVGVSRIPQSWLKGLRDWPRSVAWIATQGGVLSGVVARGVGGRRLPLPFLGLLFRNLAFASIAILHGLRRLLPPY